VLKGKLNSAALYVVEGDADGWEEGWSDGFDVGWPEGWVGRLDGCPVGSIIGLSGKGERYDNLLAVGSETISLSSLGVSARPYG
jgi:hypothetical protein